MFLLLLILLLFTKNFQLSLLTLQFYLIINISCPFLTSHLLLPSFVSNLIQANPVHCYLIMLLTFLIIFAFQCFVNFVIVDPTIQSIVVLAYSNPSLPSPLSYRTILTSWDITSLKYFVNEVKIDHHLLCMMLT